MKTHKGGSTQKHCEGVGVGVGLSSSERRYTRVKGNVDWAARAQFLPSIRRIPIYIIFTQYIIFLGRFSWPVLHYRFMRSRIFRIRFLAIGAG
jgi:hypothetical protein